MRGDLIIDFKIIFPNVLSGDRKNYLYKILTKAGVPPKPLDLNGQAVVYLDEANSIDRDNTNRSQQPPEENEDLNGGGQRVQCAQQ